MKRMYLWDRDLLSLSSPGYLWWYDSYKKFRIQLDITRKSDETEERKLSENK